MSKVKMRWCFESTTEPEQPNLYESLCEPCGFCGPQEFKDYIRQEPAPENHKYEVCLIKVSSCGVDSCLFTSHSRDQEGFLNTITPGLAQSITPGIG